jgi:hypothetical protein
MSSTAWALAGRSAREPMVIATYGDAAARPRFRTGHDNGFATSPYAAVRHLRLMDIHLHAHVRDPADPAFDSRYRSDTPTGIQMLALLNPLEDVLIEGCEVAFYGVGAVIHNAKEVRLADIRLRANNIHDAWRLWDGPAKQGYSQGVYANGIDGLLLEQNVIEHNGGLFNYPGDGRHPLPPGVERKHVAVTWFNRQVYADAQNRNVRLVANIIANGDGAQLRSGGRAHSNLFVRTIQALVGGDDDDLRESGGFGFVVQDNVFLEGTDFPAESATAGTRAVGVQLTNVSDAGALIDRNVFVRDASTGPGGVAIHLRGGQRLGNGEPAVVRAAQVTRNVLSDWRGGIQIDGRPGLDILRTTVRGNVVSDSTGGGAALSATRPGRAGDGVAWAANRYLSSAPKALAHRIDNKSVDFDAWRQAVGENGSSSQAAARAVSGVRLDAAMGSAVGSYEQAWARLRQQTRWAWDPALETTAINRRLRERLGVTP